MKHLAAAGVRSAAIHGNKSQPQREAALGAFRRGDIRILVATDIAARGIDVGGISHVFNFELPNVAEQYVHRIGRTARAGAAGIAVAFVAEDERAYLRQIEKLTRVRLEMMPLPENFVSEKNSLPKPAPSAPSARREDGRGMATITMVALVAMANSPSAVFRRSAAMASARTRAPSSGPVRVRPRVFPASR